MRTRHQKPVLVVAVLLAGCLGADLAPADAEPAGLACRGPCVAGIDTSPGGGWEPHVAVHPDDPDHVVVASRAQEADGPTSYVLWFDFHVSRDGGRTWNVTTLRETAPFGTADPDAPNVVGDPVLAFLPDGTLLATGATLQYVAVPGGGVMRNVDLYVVRSPDGGAHFQEPVSVARSEGVVVQADPPGPLEPVAAAALLDLPDKPWIATGPDGTALLAWTRVVGLHPEEPAGARSDILFSASRDGGRTWGDPGVVAGGGSLQGPAPAVGSDGSWYVAYADWAAREARVAVSRDQGRTWSDTVAVPHVWMPALALSPGHGRDGGDRLLLATARPGPGDGEHDALHQTPTLSWSDDGGTTWSAPLALDEPDAPGRVLPSVAADADGVVYVTHAHAGETSTFHAAAVRPGAGVSRLVLDPDIRGHPSRMGDYLGLAAGTAGAFAVWTTTDDGTEFDVVGASLGTHRAAANP